MFDLAAVQSALAEQQLTAWLLYDFRGSNPVARRILDLDQQPVTSRRWFYYIPAQGEPTQIVHRIEPRALERLPGSRKEYLRWQELEAALAAALAGGGRVAMEYSPRAANPYVARVDGGTLELVRGCGVEICSSGDLVQGFEAVWDDNQWELHRAAAVHTRAAFDAAFSHIASWTRGGGCVRESEVQQVILDHFAANGVVTSHPPIVAVGPHSGDPHYEITPETDAVIRHNDFVLIDLWAKMDRPRAVYSDLTRVGFVDARVWPRHAEIFALAAAARDAALNCVRSAFAQDRPLAGWQVDRAARDVIEAAGYGDFFCHRTGHSIGQETHGNGANMDDLETREERRVLPRTCFSIEPGIYLPEFGVRTEINVFIDAAGQVHVTGGEPQTEVLAILA